MTKENSGMTTFLMKWIAVLTMITDHVGRMFFPDVHIFNIIGRIAFPLFAFLLIEGFVHTGNLKKYMLRMLIFACISEIAMCICGSICKKATSVGSPISLVSCSILASLHNTLAKYSNLLEVSEGVVSSAGTDCPFT